MLSGEEQEQQDHALALQLQRQELTQQQFFWTTSTTIFKFQ